MADQLIQQNQAKKMRGGETVQMRHQGIPDDLFIPNNKRKKHKI